MEVDRDPHSLPTTVLRYEDGLTVETFDANGLLLEIAGPSGMRQTVIHDADRRLTKVESSLGDGPGGGWGDIPPNGPSVRRQLGSRDLRRTVKTP